MTTIGLAANPHKEQAVQLASELAEWLMRRGIRPVLTEEVAARTDKANLGGSDEEVAGSDLLLVLGGDGTMLRHSRLAAPLGTPMLGVNFGQYGFITETHPREAKRALSQILKGDYHVSERVVLEITVTRQGKPIGAYHALNDAVVSKGPPARMLGLNLFINGKFIVTYLVDGIIVATPTGSTAYSLSGGGPVVNPDVSALIVTPVCPHTLNARSLLVPDDEVVRIAGDCSADQPEMVLTTDGLVVDDLTRDDAVEIRKAGFKAKLIHLEPESFYDKLQTRLRWGERFSGGGD